ncbi:MAG TPA: hypothetical protein H9757_04560 [Candidatus Mediterraneibacter faecigallinarum]|uniref:Uncharacterized protein n=1 Tax=Candidatus Mediterraneibacter faecigallinarum TaxID=2838669 RepID=A0A9D2NWI2_9FIRM|nr:hypothetical protein [Candidatus Mediterraneibacter faecigallinarum]
MTLNELKSIENPTDRLAAANEMKRNPEEMYHTCTQKADAFVDDTRQIIEGSLSPVFKDATERIREIAEQTTGNISKLEDIASEAGKVIKEKTEQLQDTFLEEMKVIYTPLIDVSTEVKVRRIQIELSTDEEAENIERGERTSEEDISNSDSINIFYRSFLSSFKVLAQLQSQQENGTHSSNDFATAKQDTLMAMEDLYLKASSGLRQYMMKLSTAYGEVALNVLSTQREEISEISKRKV